ncbi:hypothetical protein [Gracilibacillus sp. D59]|uniref:hypothetical protein n=1 Tax=Gracilibacillus sp. D59 TaxID=3457434 RepID=UPI003FCDD718
MDEERKHIIINEINYWKTHHLLPNQYCDFLLALYTEGEGTKENKISESRQTPYYLLLYFLDTLLILFPILIFQFTDNKLFYIIGIALTIICSLGMIKAFSRNDQLKDSYAVMIFFLVFLFSTMLWINEYFRVYWITYTWILINSISWIIFGKIRRQFFLQIAGVFILIILAIMFGFHYF